MSDEIISSLITAVSAVVCCLLGIKIGKENVLKGLSKDVLKQQLDLVYSPIVRQWYQNPEQSISDRISFIEKVFWDNFDLTMPSLFEKYHKIKSCEKVQDKDFDDLYRAIISNYNWNKKLLGYPYESSKIYGEYLPTHGKYAVLIAFIQGVAFVFGCVSLCIATMPLYDARMHDLTNANFYSFCLIYAIGFLLFGISYWLDKFILLHQHRKEKSNHSDQ